MHLEKRSAAALSAACCAGVKWVVGRSFWHLRCVAWNWVERGSIPLLEPNVIAPLELGSGKLLTPFARMHFVNLRAALRLPAPIATRTPTLPPDDVEEPPPFADELPPDEDELPLCDLATFATPGELLPPQPATVTAIASAPSAASAVGPGCERAIGFVTFS